jgi:DNA-binding NtrC family response regulator
VAATTVTVLIRGETGTGKELVARAIYQHGNRNDKPFVAVNCAAIPETLLESELFGHERGAYTGAHARRVGRFEQANLGTIFLDEIGNIPLRQQSRLLRVLETGEMERVGSSRTKRVNVRVISATNSDLEFAIRAGSFREDLLFRLNTVEIHIPALRQRREDIPALATHFLRRYCKRYRIEVTGFAPTTLEAMMQYMWPGNVRELEHTLERAVLMCRSPEIHVSDLGLNVQRPQGQSLEDLSIEEVEIILVRKALQRFQGNVSQAAEALGLSRGALYRRMERYGL